LSPDTAALVVAENMKHPATSSATVTGTAIRRSFSRGPPEDGGFLL
jgi:hypothetical protein